MIHTHWLSTGCIAINTHWLHCVHWLIGSSAFSCSLASSCATSSVCMMFSYCCVIQSIQLLLCDAEYFCCCQTGEEARQD